MLPAGAADCHGQVAAIEAQVLRNPALQESQDVLVHLREIGLRIQEFAYLGIAPGKASQVSVPVRIGQASQVKNKICVRWNAMLESKRFDQHRQHVALAAINTLPNLLSEFIDAGS